MMMKGKLIMAGINKVIIVGRLGQDPEIRYMPDGTAITNFSVATSETWKDKQTGEKKERTEWHRIVAWRQLGEICGKYLSKGRQVYVEGKLQTRSWEKDGVTRYSTEIVASDVQFLGSVSDNAGGQRPGGRQQEDQGYPEPPMPNHQDDDIPF
jgi:single-strand DNA-binding protein